MENFCFFHQEPILCEFCEEANGITSKPELENRITDLQAEMDRLRVHLRNIKDVCRGRKENAAITIFMICDKALEGE